MQGVIATTISGILIVSLVYIMLQGQRAAHADVIAKGVTGDFGRVNRVFQGGN